MEEVQKPKIALYAKRPFGEKLNVSFDFIKENWKQLFKYSTYLILPICLLQAANFTGVMGTAMDISAMQTSGQMDADPMSAFGLAFILNYAGLIFFSFLGGLLLSSLVYALFQLYNEREERLNGITFSDIKPLFFRNIKRLLIIGLVSFLLFIIVVVVIGIFAALSLATMVLTIPLFFALLIPLALVSPIYLFEKIPIVDAFKKTFRLGFTTWGGIFLIILIMGIIASVIQGVAAIPWYVIYFIKLVFTMSDGGEATSSVGLNFTQYLFSILMLYGTYLSAILSIVGLAYQYGHASEVVDSITIESDIDNFDKL